MYDPPVAKGLKFWHPDDDKPRKDPVREQEKLQWASHRDRLDELNQR
jgi:hypothetical protein